MQPTISGTFINISDREVLYAFYIQDKIANSEYRIMQQLPSGSLVKTYLLQINGEPHIYCNAGEMTPVSEGILRMDVDSIFIFFKQLLVNLLKLESNGFLRLQNVSAKLEHIFVGRSLNNVSNIYIPSQRGLYLNEMEFINDLKETIANPVEKISRQTESPFLIELIKDLRNPELGLYDFADRFQIKRTSEGKILTEHDIKLISLDPALTMDICITKEVSILGRKKPEADELITGSRLVGRAHCKITRKNDSFMITDLNSRNGSRLNGVRMKPGVPYPLSNGDLILLADREFRVNDPSCDA